MKKVFFVFALQTISLSTVYCQKTIALNNRSFEDMAQPSKTPRCWYDASGNTGKESPPDVQPSAFGVRKKAKDGETYLGLVVRDNNTVESVGQKLETPLLKDVTYRFSLWACRSEQYISYSRKEDKDVNYNTLVSIELWANEKNKEAQQLGRTPPIATTDWQKFDFEFTPKINYTYFVIKAYYAEKTGSNGNVLIDNVSDIVPKTIFAIAAVAKPQPTEPVVKSETPQKVVQTEPTKIINDTPKLVEKPKPIDMPKVKVGQIIKIENLQFEADKAVITEGSFPALDKIFLLLKNNPNLKVEIGGHTNLVIDKSIALRLSTDRAHAVFDYLVNKGIDKKRLIPKGYGKSLPIENDTSKKANKANKINQRVEIKVLSNDDN